MRLRSEGDQQSEADKTKVTFETEAERKSIKSKISNVNLSDAHFDYMSDAHVQKPTLIYFQTEPAVKLRPRSSTDSIRRSAVTFQTFFSRQFQ